MIDFKNIARLTPPHMLLEAIEYQITHQDFYFSILFFGLVSGNKLSTITNLELQSKVLVVDNLEFPITSSGYELLKPIKGVQTKLLRYRFNGSKKKAVDNFSKWYNQKHQNDKVILTPPNDFYLYSNYVNTYIGYLRYYKLLTKREIAKITARAYIGVNNYKMPEIVRAINYYDYDYELLWKTIDKLVDM